MLRTWIEIDKKALLHNLEQFLHLIGPEVKFMAVVKANAYGHGLKEVAKIIHDTEYMIQNTQIWFGVDSIDEALILRRQGIQAPILILGYAPLDRLQEAVENDIRLTVYNRETIEMLGRIMSQNPSQPPLNKGGVSQNFPPVNEFPLLPEEGLGVVGEGVCSVRVHLKVETGTSRQGIDENEILDFVKFVKQFPQIEIEGLSTHFANIEDTNDTSYGQGQLDAFKRVVGVLEANGVAIPVKHTACSAATIAFPETRFDMVRVGISLYGLWSIDRQQMLSKIELNPVLSWKTIIAQIKKIPAGTAVGYGLTERVGRDSTIAVVPVGYYDGYDRKLSSIGEVLVHGQRCKVIGRVCMNMMIVDVTDVTEARLEDEVVLLGSQGGERIGAEELAQKIGTINYEVIARLNPLLPRIII